MYKIFEMFYLAIVKCKTVADLGGMHIALEFRVISHLVDVYVCRFTLCSDDSCTIYHHLIQP